MSARRRRVFLSVTEKRQPAGTVFKNSLKEWRQRSQARIAREGPAPEKGQSQIPPA